ncbi:hypothetical protein BT96DRAFT_870247 [Gymnopus androsaceus JB14]|uniref:Uncharacterized protein n=1 Tax=Gymnopus androsaceus JB14 TaxID=1447944 RepID=A0A6A4IGN0_9AGAR|nr:hypothetical protein BT96DRAFT_870247 [Gymnopus androsaceus JB14]
MTSGSSTNEIAVFDEKPAKRAAHRFSFRAFNVQSHEERKPALSEIREHEKKEHAAAALSKRLAKPLSTNSDRRAQQSAMLVRGMIIGPTSSSPMLSSAVAKPQMSKLKSQLMQPKSANKIIAHLRDLSVDSGDGSHAKRSGPIHAVCLAYTDSEEDDIHFSKLDSAPASGPKVASFFAVTSSAPVEALSTMFNEMHVIDLLKVSDFGLGQPGDGPGLLAGALPTAETVINGIEQITPQLMALGYATGRAIVPDHTGIHPPQDRMSVLTYWWGLEVILPPPSLVYLANADSISGAVVNFLSALALINGGVREILPFIRYISQFIDFEFKTIQGQNKGKGVVCAATWIMPAALIPRPWDFTPPEPKPAPKPAPTEEESNPTLPTSDKPEPAPTNSSPPSASVPAEPSAPEAAPPVQMSSPAAPAAEKTPVPAVQPTPATGSVPIPAVSGIPAVTAPVAQPSPSASS